MNWIRLGLSAMVSECKFHGLLLKKIVHKPHSAASLNDSTLNFVKGEIFKINKIIVKITRFEIWK